MNASLCCISRHKSRTAQLEVKRVLRNACPKCGTAMSYTHEPTGPEYFSYETGSLHQNFVTQYVCPACGFVVPSTDDDVPF